MHAYLLNVCVFHAIQRSVSSLVQICVCTCLCVCMYVYWPLECRNSGRIVSEDRGRGEVTRHWEIVSTEDFVTVPAHTYTHARTQACTHTRAHTHTHTHHTRRDTQKQATNFTTHKRSDYKRTCRLMIILVSITTIHHHHRHYHHHHHHHQKLTQWNLVRSWRVSL